MILLTGSTGSVGLETAKCLANKGIPFRAMVRDIAKASATGVSSVEWVKGDFDDDESLRRSLVGIERVFLLAPPVENLDVVESRFISIAEAVGVKHIVNLSAVGAGIDVPHRFGLWHGRTEKRLKESGLDFTILRPNFFMQNLIGMAGMIKGGALYVPTGEGKAPFVDVRDIAAVAANCLIEPGHVGKTYEVTGPEAIGYADIAMTLTRVLGRDVSYVDVPDEAAADSMLKIGMPTWLVDALNELNTGMKANRFTAVSDSVERIGHKSPVSVEQFVREHVAMFN
jgi:uncharacterized protein YbjT (DUF2867 family)